MGLRQEGQSMVASLPHIIIPKNEFQTSRKVAAELYSSLVHWKEKCKSIEKVRWNQC